MHGEVIRFTVAHSLRFKIYALLRPDFHSLFLISQIFPFIFPSPSSGKESERGKLGVAP